MRKVQYKSVALALAVMVLGLGARMYHAPATQAASAGKPVDPAAQVDWSTYNGGVDGDHYSSLSQITPANVAGLKQAWRVDLSSNGRLQANPLIVGRML